MKSSFNMKKVLWICNIMLPAIAKELGLPCSNREGWLSGIFGQMVKEKENLNIELGICFPTADTQILSGIKNGPFYVEKVPCYCVYEDLAHPEKYDPGLEKSLADVFRDFKPDMIHIFGTEFPHALAAARVFGRPEYTLTGIQGLCGEIAQVYMAGLPKKIQRKVTLRDFLRADSLRQQQQKFRKRAGYEAETVRLSGHVTGRTRFDREGCEKLHPGVQYHFMNETMRSSFYEGQWKPEKAEKHSIFLGQGDYPLKGFHFVLQAMPEILKQYPDTVLYVAGSSIIEHRTLKQRLKLPAYGIYLLQLIHSLGLEDKVIMTGKLKEEEMKERFLKSHVFLCASVLENSPNTVGEAMLLGVPVAAAAAGGIPDMITSHEDGLLFEIGNPKALAGAVISLFDETEDEEGNTLAQRLSRKARKRALAVHDGGANYRRLLEIYAGILGENR
jgi:glycosyltransferase involved in cell wall biosynthesis